ncbi:MAG: 4'-phosphopantetheinyl transferase superfamily protein, partial [Blastocatellia bacterium]|nr:4'-phosphopantetheinyl transferase superfamily protein [Blastocatellia bacterium]
CPPDGIVIGSDEAHVWRVSLKQRSATVSQLSSLLAPDERERADRYHRAVDRDRFTVARAVLRKIIALYLPVSAGAVKFTYNKYGKPDISDDQNECNLRFNLSHSNELALCAFTRARAIGIDIEYIREDFATLEIAEHFFAKAEVKALASLPEKQRVRAFFNCWSRKEAYIKALGLGISFPLDRFAVSLGPDAKAALLKVEDDDHEPERWMMYELLPEDGYAAALIVEMPPITLKQWDWDISPTQSR